MKKLFGFFLFLTALALFPLAGATRAQGPTILKRTISVTTHRYLRYWKTPKAAEPQYNTWCWIPKLYFEVLGPVPGGSQWQVEFSMPDGRPWFTYDLKTDELGDDIFAQINMTENINYDEMEKKAITTPAGLFPFKIILKNELLGKSDVMFAGKFKLSTYLPDQNIPEYKGKREFYVDHDWLLPIGYVWLDPRGNEAAPNLATHITFRGSTDANQMQAFLFYNGKKIGKEANKSVVAERSNSVGDPRYVYYTWEFGFPYIRSQLAPDSGGYPETHFLEKNPGQYEIRALRNGELSRTLAFSVGKDGKIALTGIAKNNKLGGIREIFPVKIVSDPIADWDKTAWQTGALYGNPLAGFTAIP